MTHHRELAAAVLLALAACAPPAPVGPGDTGTGGASGPCGDGAFGSISDPGSARFVDAALGDDATADGSRDAPFASIGAAVASAPAGAAVAILPGTYVEAPIDLGGAGPELVALEGCGSGEVIVEAADSNEPLVMVTEVSTRLRGFTMSGGAWTLTAWRGADVEASDLHIEGAQYTGVYLSGEESRLALSSSRIAGILAPGEYPDHGYGIAVDGGVVEMTDVEVADTVGAGVFVRDSSSATFERVTVHDVASGPDGSLGRGFNLESLLSGLMIDCHISAVQDAGVYALQTQNLSLSGVEVTAVEPAVLGTARSGDAVVFTTDDGSSFLDPSAYVLSAVETVLDAASGAAGETRAELVVESATAAVDASVTDASGAELALDRVFAQEGALVSGVDVTELDEGSALDLNRAPLVLESP